MNDLAKNLLLWVVILVVLLMAFQSFTNRNTVQKQLVYSEFLDQAKNGQIETATIEGQNIEGQLKGGDKYKVISPETSNDKMIGTLLDNKVKISGALPKETPFIMSVLLSFGPILLLIGVWI